MTARHPAIRPFGHGELRAQRADEAARFDERAIRDAGVPQPVLMENAGRSAAGVLVRLFGKGRVTALVGSGNNGGDALVAARTLAAWGASVRCVLTADRAADDPLLHGWPVEVIEDRALSDDQWRAVESETDVFIDGMLGTGVRGAPRARQAEVIGRLNEMDRPVVAMDVPSGVDATTGAVEGVAVRSTVTVSFGAPKLGAMLAPGRAFVGRHVTVEIGFPPITEADAPVRVLTPAWGRSHLPVRGTDTHKNQVGRVLIVGGRSGMAGAVVLSARAAFAAGAGLVRVASAPDNRAILQSAVPEAIFVDASNEVELSEAVAQADAVAVGPGLGTASLGATVLGRIVAGTPLPMLLDADALNLLAEGMPVRPESLAGRAALLTPHPGEMARLLGEETPGPDRIATLRAAVERFGVAVLLKGAPSLVADADGTLGIDTQASSDLAVAGMGDALTGVCVALMAQGLAPAEAGGVGLFLSGRAARLAGRGASLTPSDVVRWLPEARDERGVGTSDLDLPFVIFDADPVR